MKTKVGYATHSCAEHKHNCYEIIFYRNAIGRFCFFGQSIEISSGMFIVVPPNTVHLSKYDIDDAQTIYVDGDFNHIFSFAMPMVIMDNSEKDGEFIMNLILKNKFLNPEYLSSLTNALAHYLMQNIRTEKAISTVIQDIATKISDNFYDSGINIGDILRKSGYSQDYIRAQFKAFTGKTPVEFLTELRINHACYLMEIYKDSISLNEISEKCGYTDYVYFSRKFKQVTGVSPKRYMEV